jgi:hypothetical protein
MTWGQFFERINTWYAARCKPELERRDKARAAKMAQCMKSMAPERLPVPPEQEQKQSRIVDTDTSRIPSVRPFTDATRRVVTECVQWLTRHLHQEPAYSREYRDVLILLVQRRLQCSVLMAKQHILASDASHRHWGFSRAAYTLDGEEVMVYADGFEVVGFHDMDRQTLVRRERVTCQVMMASEHLLTQTPNPAGLDSELEKLQDTQRMHGYGNIKFAPVRGKAFAFLHVHGNHWVLIENLSGHTVRVWDGQWAVRSARVRGAIHALFAEKYGKPAGSSGSAYRVVPVLCVDLHPQRDAISCGPRAVAFARQVLAGEPISKIRQMQFKHRWMHEWLLFGFEDGSLGPFPHDVVERSGEDGHVIEVTPPDVVMRRGQARKPQPRGSSSIRARATRYAARTVRRTTPGASDVAKRAWDAQ